MKKSNVNALALCNKMTRIVRRLIGMGFEVEDVVMGGDVRPHIEIVSNEHTAKLVDEQKAFVYEWAGNAQERQPMAQMMIDDVRIIFKAQV